VEEVSSRGGKRPAQFTRGRRYIPNSDPLEYPDPFEVGCDVDPDDAEDELDTRGAVPDAEVEGEDALDPELPPSRPNSVAVCSAAVWGSRWVWVGSEAVWVRALR